MGDLDPSLYFDHSATTPPRPEVLAAFQKAATEAWGNPSSLHSWGQRAAIAVEIARQQVATLIGAAPERVVFTSGGTESDNLAIVGIARQFESPQHLIISSVEHAAIAKPALYLESQGWQVTRLPVNEQGQVSSFVLADAIQPDTVLVSVIHGQSEVGSVQPIADMAEICREAGVLFHSDCVQTAGRLPLDVDKLGVDLLSMSSHKLYGPQGVGALYVRDGVDIAPVALGGKQEATLRAGTQAVPSIAGFGVAAELAQQELREEAQRLRGLQAQLAEAIAAIDGLVATGPTDLDDRLPHHLSYCTDRHTGTWLVTQLNLAGFAVSAGSACSSGELQPNPTLLASGFSEQQALGAIRIAMGKATTEGAIVRLAETLQVLMASAPMSVS
ncbi:MAG: cysteine desulfurase family protein [Cyanobacteria bacterium P01_A01_bin.3]